MTKKQAKPKRKPNHPWRIYVPPRQPEKGQRIIPHGARMGIRG